jgi:hypothetical protein
MVVITLRPNCLFTSISGLARRVRRAQRHGSLGVHCPRRLLFRRFGDERQIRHGCGASRLVRSHSARPRDWRSTMGVISAFQTI